MLFFITLFLLFISIAACIYISYIDHKYDSKNNLKGIKKFIWWNSDSLTLITGILIGIFSVIVLITTIRISSNYIRAEADKAMNQELYNSLIYKAETESIRDDFGIVNKEYIDEVQNWNTNLVNYQTITHNFWIGIFYPDWYDEFETIDLEKIKMKE